MPAAKVHSPAHKLIASIRIVARSDFVAHLGVIPEIRNEMEIPLRDEQERARTREAGEIANVGKARDDERIDVSRGDCFAERGDARGTTVRHWWRPEAS